MVFRFVLDGFIFAGHWLVLNDGMEPAGEAIVFNNSRDSFLLLMWTPNISAIWVSTVHKEGRRLEALHPSNRPLLGSGFGQ